LVQGPSQTQTTWEKHLTQAARKYSSYPLFHRLRKIRQEFECKRTFASESICDLFGYSTEEANNIGISTTASVRAQKRKGVDSG
jgi:hypothetical protein